MEAPSRHDVLELALRYFATVDEEVDVADEGLVTSDGRVYGLEPLRRRLAYVDHGCWGDAVEAHFRALESVDPSIPERFEDARGGLRSAVVADSDLGMLDGALAERPLVDGLGERLMLKRGSLGLTITSQVVDEWDVAAATVWQVARSNALWDEPVAVSGKTGDGFVTLTGGPWTSTAIIDVGRHLGSELAYGALVSVPSRDEVLAHRIGDGEFPESAVAMLTAAASMYARAPLPVCCDLFWWWEGGLERICTPGSDGYRYIRVPEFSRMLWRLEEALASGTE